MKLQSWLLKSLLALMCLATTGCGNMLNPSVPLAPTGSYMISPITDDTEKSNSDLNYNCSGNYSIAPKSDIYADGSGYYTVCSSKNTSTPGNVVVHGKSTTSSTICIFPAFSDSFGNTRFIPSNSSGTSPLYSCVQATTDGAYFSFSASAFANWNFNSAYIVEGPYARQMNLCLLSNYSSSSCPAYSFGKFR